MTPHRRTEHLLEEVEMGLAAGISNEKGARGGRAAVRSSMVTTSVAILVCFSLVAGCSKKEPESSYDPASDTTGGQMGEGTLSGSSLDQFKRGTLGAGEQGPLQDVHFGYDSYELSDNARELLRLNADWLRENPTAKVEIEGHTDSRGTVEYNLALGAKRATAARDYLVSLGIPGSRITTISYGKELPLCHEESASCWDENRRAHFVVLQ